MQNELLKVKERKTELENKIYNYSKDYAKFEGSVFDGGFYKTIDLNLLSEDIINDIRATISELATIYKALNIRFMTYVDENINKVYM